MGARGRFKSKERSNDYYEFEPNNFVLETMANAELIYFDGDDFNPGNQYNPGFFALNTFLGNLPLSDSNAFESENAPKEYVMDNYKARENILAGYVRLDYDLSESLSLVTGVRIEQTNAEYSGNIILDDEDVLDERLSLIPHLTLPTNREV